MKNFLLRFTEGIENTPLTPASFALAFLALIITRLTLENALASFTERSFFFLFFEFTHTLLFFLCSYLILLPLVRFAGGVDLKKAANLLLFGFLIILTPPLIDTFLFQGSAFWSFYEFDGLLGLSQHFLSFFGDTPQIGITYGVRVEIAVTMVALGVYSYLKSGRLTKALFVTLLAYFLLFLLGTFPSWVTFLVLFFEKSLLTIGNTDIAGLFLAPEQILGRNLDDFRSVLNFKMSLVYTTLLSMLLTLFFFRNFPRYFWALAKNMRLPQVTYHNGLLFLGMILAVSFTDASVPFQFFPVLAVIALFLAVESAWLASVIVNDLNDTAIDTLTNPKRPLIEDTIPRDLYAFLGILFFIASLLFSGIVSFSALLLLLAYQGLAWLYSAPPLRLKKYPGVATLFAAAAGILVLILGFVSVADTHTITALPGSLLFFLFMAYFLIIPIKDFKDLAGDKKDGVYTIPVLLGETLGKQVVGALVFLVYVLSPSILNLPALFGPALLFGSLSFFALQKGTTTETSFFAFRKLPGIILGLAECYGIAIAIILFW